jgi:hypothetical protein
MDVPPVAWVRISDFRYNNASALSIEGEDNNACAIKGATANYLLSSASSSLLSSAKPSLTTRPMDSFTDSTSYFIATKAAESAEVIPFDEETNGRGNYGYCVVA